MVPHWWETHQRKRGRCLLPLQVEAMRSKRKMRWTHVAWEWKHHVACATHAKFNTCPTIHWEGQHGLQANGLRQLRKTSMGETIPALLVHNSWTTWSRPDKKNTRRRCVSKRNIERKGAAKLLLELPLGIGVPMHECGSQTLRLVAYANNQLLDLTHDLYSHPVL